MVGNSVLVSILTFKNTSLITFFSLLLAFKDVIHQTLRLFNRIDGSPCGNYVSQLRVFPL